MMKKIIVTGCTGTLGSELIQQLKKVFPPYNIIEFTHDKVDCSDYNAVKSAVESEQQNSAVDFIINCAALVNTVGIENSFDVKNQSFKSNVLIPKYLAAICNVLHIKLIHISTDYVFSELSQKSVDGIYDPFPLNTYGYHKLLGELYVEKFMKESDFSTMRVGWIYGYSTKRSFIHKFIRNIIDTMKSTNNSSCEVRCVDDQISTPTSVKFISDGICELVKTENMVGTAALCPIGTVSKYDYAMQILDNVKRLYGLNVFDNVKVTRMKTQQKDIGYPKDSRLEVMSENVINRNTSWQDDLKEYMLLHKVEFTNFINDLI